MKEILRRRVALLVLPLLCVFAGCEEIIKESVKIDPSTLTVEATGGTAEVTVSAPAAWVLQMPAETWVSADVTSGEAGSHRVTLTFTANTDTTAREARLTVVCAGAEGTLDITQQGRGGSTPDPGYDGKLIRRVTITDGDRQDEDRETMEFEYSGSQLTKMTITSEFDEGPESYVYLFTYEGTTIICRSEDGEEENRGEMDANGRVTRATDYDFDGDAEDDSYAVTAEYNAEGQLVSETEIGDVGNAKYEWRGGDLVRSVWKSYYEDTTDFAYSEYENKGNLDLNWIFAGSYTNSSLGKFGLIDAAGARSAHYVMPDAYWNDASYPDNADYIEPPISEDLIGTTRSFTRTRYRSDESAREADFTFDEDGDLTGISVSIPVWKVTIERTYTIVLNEDPYYEEIDGKRYYYDFHLELVSSEETGREPAEPDRTEVIVEY